MTSVLFLLNKSRAFILYLVQVEGFLPFVQFTICMKCDNDIGRLAQFRERESKYLVSK